jgi:phage terminase large subunit GpA-like protein
MLSPEASAAPGRWRTDKAEYQRGIMDAFSDPQVEQVVIMSSAQIGKTEILNNIVGFFIDQDPSPMLVVQPTLDMGQAWSKDRLAPMLRDTPSLQGRVKDVKSRFSDNTILHKKFPGGHLTVCGANSPSSLASRPVRVVLCDEVDRYPVSAGTEGDPVKLAWKRSAAFWNRKGLLCSTPTVKADPSMGSGSRIELAFEHSDKRFFFLACPHCRYEQVLKWAQVQWPAGEPEQAQYYCEACGAAWTEGERRAAIRNGRWKATAPFHGTAGFHIWEAYSPFSSLSGIARAFLEAKKQTETLKTWVNTVLGESWEDAADKVNATPLMQRREDYAPFVPEGAAVLTAGVDTQDDRLEVEVVAWGADFETWNVDYKIFYGDPNRDAVWEDLYDYLRSPFRHQLGRSMTVAATCVDSAGHCSDAVYRFCKKHEKQRIFAIKGVPESGKPIAGRPSKRNKGKVKLFPVGVDTAKEVVYSRLRVEEPGPGYCHFPMERDQEYFDQLTAEKRTTKYTNGRPKMVWSQTRKRNEALDCRVYATAAYAILKPSIGALLRKMGQLHRQVEQIPVATAAPEPRRPAILEEETVPEAVVPRKRIARRRSGGFVQGW